MELCKVLSVIGNKIQLIFFWNMNIVSDGKLKSYFDLMNNITQKSKNKFNSIDMMSYYTNKKKFQQICAVLI